MFVCGVCGVSRTSKFALKRHTRHEHPSAEEPTTHQSEAVVAAPTAPAPQKCVDDTSVATTQQPMSRQTRGHRDRTALDMVIRRLRSRYQRNADYLRKPSAAIADALQQETRSYGLARMVYLAVAVTAKTFAEDKRQPAPCATRRVRLVNPPAVPRNIPRHPRPQPMLDNLVPTPTGISQGAPRRGRRGDRTLDPVRRVLFRSQMDVAAVADQQPGNSDDDWRRCIWRSYATGEIKPPSPLGFRWAPAAIFSSSSVAVIPESPKNGESITWGPDSPDEPLVENTIAEVPGWPLFQEDGELLRRDSPRWKTRFVEWRSDRAQASPLRVGSSDPPSSYDIVRPSPHAAVEDVRLPSPPAAGLAALLKLKRELCRSQYPAVARRRKKCAPATRPTTRASSKRPASPQHTPDIELLAPEDLF